MAPSKPRPAPPPPAPPNTLILDNGAYTMKTALLNMSAFTSDESPPSKTPPHIIPNTLARSRTRTTYTGSALGPTLDYGEMSFRRPVERGSLVNWELQSHIWTESFLSPGSPVPCDPSTTALVLSEAPNTPAALQTNTDQMVFEEFEFASYYRALAPTLASYDTTSTSSEQIPPPQAMIVIDSGYSHTTITPVVHHRPLQGCIRRLPLGGKHLTNYLKELVSVRHYNMMDEVYLMERVKEGVCYVSPDAASFSTDLDRCWKGRGGSRRTVVPGEVDTPSVVVDYVLPDYNTNPATPGYVRAPLAKVGKPASGKGTKGEREGEFMTLGNERFTVPEILFNPEDIGMKCAGVPELVMQCLQGVPGGLWPAMLGNVVVVGGNARLPGFIERLSNDLRCLAPDTVEVRVRAADDPITAAFHGGVNLARLNDGLTLGALMVTREEYLENGAGWMSRRFAGTAGR